jgi:hypothetical protein
METCRLVGVPAAVERSRSGNGAHVWFFFSTPVAAADARRMGVLSADRNDDPSPSAQHGVVRSPLSQSGHDAARRVR